MTTRKVSLRVQSRNDTSTTCGCINCCNYKQIFQCKEEDKSCSCGSNRKIRNFCYMNSHKCGYGNCICSCSNCLTNENV